MMRLVTLYEAFLDQQEGSANKGNLVKPDGLGFIPVTHMVEGKNGLLSDLHTLYSMHLLQDK